MKTRRFGYGHLFLLTGVLVLILLASAPYLESSTAYLASLVANF